MIRDTRDLTPMDARRIMVNLQDAGYNVPRDTDINRLAKAWCRYLTGFPVVDVETAVDRYISDGKHYWPKPGEILERARGDGDKERKRVDDSPRGRYLHWEQSHDGPCPVCGATMARVGRSRRLAYLHNYQEHQRQGIPHVGPPMRQEDERMYAAYGSWEDRSEEKVRRMLKRRGEGGPEPGEPTESERRAKRAAQEFFDQQGAGVS